MSKIQAKECQNVEYKRSWKDEYLKWYVINGDGSS